MQKTGTVKKLQKTALVRNKLLEEITKSSPGDQLLSELVLTKKFGVSQTTIRRAIKKLVTEGLLYRKHGSGTYVAENPHANRKMLSLKSFFQDYHMPGNDIHSETDLKPIRFSIWGNRTTSKIYQNAVDSFEQTHKDMHITTDLKMLTGMQVPEYFEEIEKGVIPDVFCVNCNHLLWLLKNNSILPLDKYINSETMFPLNSIEPHVRELITYNGQTWMLPRNLQVFTLCYNRDIFDKERIAYPNEMWTWDDYLNAAQALTKRTETGKVEQYGAIIHREYHYLAPVIWSYGGEFIDEDGKVKLNTPESIAGIRFATDLALKHKVTPDLKEWGLHLGKEKPKLLMQLFVDGKLAMYLSFSSNALSFIKKDLKFNWDIAMIPQGPAGRFSPNNFSGWALGANSKFPEEGAEFIKFLSGHEGLKKTEDTYDMPALNVEPVLRDFYKNDGRISIFNLLAMKNYIRNYTFNGYYWPFIARHIADLLQDIYYNNVPAEKAVNRVSANIQKAMDIFLRL